MQIFEVPNCPGCGAPRELYGTACLYCGRGYRVQNPEAAAVAALHAAAFIHPAQRPQLDDMLGINTARIADGSITSAKIRDCSITAERLAFR